MNKKNQGPRVLVFDIETSPILGHVWSLWENNVSLNQIHTDWHVLSWAAKWLDEPASKIMYMDQRSAKNIENDSALLKAIWHLLDAADVVITQNGVSFDQKKLNARFILSGFQPPSTFRHIDTRLIAKKNFAFTSTKLEYMADKLCVKYKKLTKRTFSGFDLWKECLNGNIVAWKEMELYNKHDVLVLEELYHKLIPWGSAVNFNLYNDDLETVCKCGSTEFKRQGFFYTQIGKYQRYRCKKCGSETRDRFNLLSDAKKAAVRPTTR